MNDWHSAANTSQPLPKEARPLPKIPIPRQRDLHTELEYTVSAALSRVSSGQKISDTLNDAPTFYPQNTEKSSPSPLSLRKSRSESASLSDLPDTFIHFNDRQLTRSHTLSSGVNFYF